MMPHRRRVVLLLLLLPLLAACGKMPTSGKDVPRITVEELKAMLDAGEKVVIVDTRVSRQYQIRHIPGAISMPVLEVEARYEELPKDATIAFY